MEKLKIFLNGRPDKGGFDNAYFLINVEGKRSKLFLPKELKIPATLWKNGDDGEGQRVKNDPGFTERLNEERDRLKSIIMSLEYNKLLTIENIKKEYQKGTDKRLSKMKLPPPIFVFQLGFLEAFEEFQKINKDRFASSYLRGYRSTKLLIEEFDKIADWDSVKDEWLTKFHTFLLKKKFQPNYIFNIYKSIRGVVRLGEARGIKVPQDCKFFKVPQEEKNNVFLSKLDVEKLEKVQTFTLDEERVKELFLFRVYCGLRFQDLKMMSFEKLKDGKMPFYIQKSSKNHLIPVPVKAQEILRKYGSLDFGNKYYEQKENELIKKLCERVSIDAPFEIMKREGKKVITNIVPKHVVVSTHTARRTWARLAYESGWNILTISRIIGHSDTHTTLKYIGVSKEDFENLPDIF